MARNVPRLSFFYERYAETFFLQGNEHSAWFYLMAAWAYEDDDEKIWNPPQLPENDACVSN